MKIDKNIFVPLLGSLVAVIMKYLFLKQDIKDYIQWYALRTCGCFWWINYASLFNECWFKLPFYCYNIIVIIFDVWRMYYFCYKDRKDIQFGIIQSVNY